jgi:hypothetical protein
MIRIFNKNMNLYNKKTIFAMLKIILRALFKKEICDEWIKLYFFRNFS